MKLLQSLIGFLGRVCLSAIFIAAGIHLLLDWQGAEHYLIGTLCDWLTLTLGNERLQGIFEMAINWSFFLLCGAVFCTIVGGLMVLLGLNVRLGAFFLLLFLIPVTVLFHHFWTLQGFEQETQLSMFIKNVSIIGGLLILLAYGNEGSKCTRSKEKKRDEA